VKETHDAIFYFGNGATMSNFNLHKENPNAIGKAMEILTLLTESRCELGTNEIALRSGFNKATTSRTLQTLCDYGYVLHNYTSKKYRLGPVAYKMSANVYIQSIQDILAMAKDYSDQLCRKINETVSLEVWSGETTVACHVSLCNQMLRAVPSANHSDHNFTVDVLPIHAAAGAKSILAFKNIGESKQILQRRPLAQFTECTVTDPNTIQARLAQYNKQGYATDIEEMYEGICAIGVPIFDQLNRPVASVVSVLPEVRFTPTNEKHIAEETKHCAQMISQLMRSKPYDIKQA
jgi:DNA-binding IclR family transcriptional regulator